MRRFYVILLLLFSFSLFADIPSSGFASQSATNPGGALTDFTLMINLADVISDQPDFSTGWNTDTGGYGKATKGDGTTELATDWIDLDNGAETGWVRVKWSGTLASSGVQTVRLFPPNTANDLYAAGDTYGSDNAYNSGWVGYWPLEEDPSGGAPQMLDRTSNDINGTTEGTMLSGDSVPAQVANGLEFDGTDQLVNFGRGSPLDDMAAMTLSTWVTIDSLDFNVIRMLMDKADLGSGETGWRWRVRDIAGIRSFELRADFASGDIIRRSPANSINTATQYMLSVTWDGSNDASNIHLYIDGFEVGSYLLTQDGIGGRVSDTSLDLGFGGIAINATRTMDGIMDEGQVHDSVRSADWISEEYSQTNGNAAFWGTWGWTGGGEPPSGIAVLRRRIMGYLIVFNFTNFLLLINVISGLLLTHTMMKLKQVQKQLQWYSKSENIKALFDLNQYLEGPV